jgi:hypothetical protein
LAALSSLAALFTLAALLSVEALFHATTPMIVRSGMKKYEV